jgi:predicted Zn-dependent protease
MKKFVLSATLLLSVATFAQKEELKTLKKIYDKETISVKDLEAYKTANSTLLNIATEVEDKVYSDFYNGMLPLVEIASLGAKAKPADQLRLMNKKNLDGIINAVLSTLEYEKKSGKKVYTDDINETLAWLKPLLSQTAFQLNSAEKYKEASSLFYSLYTLDKTDGINLENAAQLAYQAEDYTTAQKLYEELKNSDYLNNGIVFYAINKVNGAEESFPNRETRTKLISLGTYEKPRDEKVSKKKPEVYKTLAVLVAFNGDIEGAKKLYKEAKALNPKDIELLTNEADMYYKLNDLVEYQRLINEIVKIDPNNSKLLYNIGYLELSNDAKIVEEINANIKNVKKYNELVDKRKATFAKAIPYFERVFAIDPSDANNKMILKSCYEYLGQTEKAKAIN